MDKYLLIFKIKDDVRPAHPIYYYKHGGMFIPMNKELENILPTYMQPPKAGDIVMPFLQTYQYRVVNFDTDIDMDRDIMIWEITIEPFDEYSKMDFEKFNKPKKHQ